MGKLVRESISFKDAMNNLSILASLDLNAPERIGIFKKYRIVMDGEEFPETDILWLSAEGIDVLLEVIDATFRAIHEHLIDLVKNPEMDGEGARSRKAVSAMVALARESAKRLEEYLTIRLGKPVTGVMDREELRSLQHFYEQHFAALAKEDEPHEVDDTQLKNMEVVRGDREYELFYIRKEDGSAYFNAGLLRHMRLSCIESEGDTFEEDPLLQVRSMLDRDLQASAGQIVGNAHTLLVDFYKSFKRLLNHQHLTAMLNSAVTALFLAANPANLLQNTAAKTCQQYFEDFLHFLRLALRTTEYQKLIAYPPEKSDKLAHLLLNLAHGLCEELFYRKGGIKQESVGLIHRTARKGAEQPKAILQKASSLWAELLIDDEHYRSRLAKFPSGPLLKILDLIRLEDTELTPFDPIGQGNFPMTLFHARIGDQMTHILHIPSPTRQLYVQKVEILDEMRGFLRSYNAGRSQRRHLLVNLQDRTSWKEFARCRILEEMQKNAEFNSALIVITLPKQGDFYMQNNEYVNLHNAEEFLSVISKQLQSPEECGFYFPAAIKIQEIMGFTEIVLPLIHRYFFQQKKTLTRREREDLIEIFYQFLLLKIIDLTHPDSLSFTCKDAVDTGAAESAFFFAFLKLISSGFDEKSDIDYFKWLMYAPALFVRERPVDAERLNRTLTALERVEAGLAERKSMIIKELSNVLHAQLKSVKVI